MIIKCPECSHDVSSKVVSCPQCGYTIEKNAHQTILGNLKVKAAQSLSLAEKIYREQGFRGKNISRDDLVVYPAVRKPFIWAFGLILTLILTPFLLVSLIDIHDYFNNSKSTPTSSYSVQSVPSMETFCQTVNRTGQINNAEQVVEKMNDWMKLKGIKYKTSVKEVTNVTKDYCQSNPNASVDDVLDHFQMIFNVLAVIDK